MYEVIIADGGIAGMSAGSAWTSFRLNPLAEKLGCSMVGGVVETGKFQQAHPAGDAARSVQLAIMAAAEGAEAAFAINSALLKVPPIAAIS